MDRPNHVKSLPKFDGRASVGIFMGYHLQPGGKWSKEYCVFRKRNFEQFDFTKPRGLHELIPVRTQECKVTSKSYEFMLKAPYDVARRTLLQHALIRIDPDASGEAPPEPTPAEVIPDEVIDLESRPMHEDPR